MISRKIITPVYECSSSCHTLVTDNASIPSIYHIAQRETFGKFGISHSTRESSVSMPIKDECDEDVDALQSRFVRFAG